MKTQIKPQPDKATARPCFPVSVSNLVQMFVQNKTTEVVLQADNVYQLRKDFAKMVNEHAALYFLETACNLNNASLREAAIKDALAQLAAVRGGK